MFLYYGYPLTIVDQAGDIQGADVLFTDKGLQRTEFQWQGASLLPINPQVKRHFPRHPITKGC